MNAPLLLYGANGYTGRLILDAALAAGVALTIAGRRREVIEPLAAQKGVEFRVFDFADRSLAARALESSAALLLAGGPFSRTSSPAVPGCLPSPTRHLHI